MKIYYIYLNEVSLDSVRFIAPSVHIVFPLFEQGSKLPGTGAPYIHLYYGYISTIIMAELLRSTSGL
jgi:hypothetical protein